MFQKIFFTFCLGLNLIPPKYQTSNSLLPNFKPDSCIYYWEYREYELNPLSYEIIYKSMKDSVFNFDFDFNKEQYLDFAKGSSLNVLICKTKSGAIKTIHCFEDLKWFLGTIDNLEEALFIANFNGYWFEAGSYKGGSYERNKNGFKLNLYKINIPDLIEVGEKLDYKTVQVGFDGSFCEFK